MTTSKFDDLYWLAKLKAGEMSADELLEAHKKHEQIGLILKARLAACFDVLDQQDPETANQLRAKFEAEMEETARRSMELREQSKRIGRGPDRPS